MHKKSVKLLCDSSWEAQQNFMAHHWLLKMFRSPSCYVCQLESYRRFSTKECNTKNTSIAIPQIPTKLIIRDFSGTFVKLSIKRFVNIILLWIYYFLQVVYLMRIMLKNWPYSFHSPPFLQKIFNAPLKIVKIISWPIHIPSCHPTSYFMTGP